MSDTEIMRISASASRRVIGVVTMAGLGGLLLYIAMTQPPQSVFWLLFLVACALSALWAAQSLWRATSVELILTETELRDSEGEVLVTLDNVDKVDRSMFAMKPSNGFMLYLKEPRPRAWKLGLWWRLGRKLAIGGVTSGGQTKPLADMITLKVHGMPSFFTDEEK